MLEINSWVVFGGSWGSTLALAYAETHADRVRASILRGIFLCRPKEIQWFYQKGADTIFPDVWENYANVIPEEERGDMVAAFYKRLAGDDEEEKLKAARAWSIWEASTSKLFYDPDMVGRFQEDDALSLAFARIECHYFINNSFFETDNWLIENVDKIRHIPTVIVQGRYDVVCPMTSAWDLHKAFPESELVIVPDAGHSALEKGIASALVEAADKFRGIGD
jgi:proline iminopeptidase